MEFVEQFVLVLGIVERVDGVASLSPCLSCGYTEPLSTGCYR